MSDDGSGIYTYSDPRAPVQQYNLSVNGTGSNMIYNPGLLSPDQENPYASQVLGQMQGLQGYQGQIMNEAFDPTHYNGLKANAIMGQTTALDNQYAKMGLAGSSANLGADQGAINNTSMQFYNRQMQDQRSALTGMMGMDQQYFGDLMGIQGGYNDFQNQGVNDWMGINGMNNSMQGANNQMYGQLAGAGMSGISAYMGYAAMAAAMA